MSEHILLEVTQQGVATITLNRPDKGNAFSDETIDALLQALETIKSQPAVRCLLLKGKGKHFSTGADLNWMKSIANSSYEDNLADAKRLALLMSTLNELPVPTLAAVQGCAFGGALGLLCCCDIVIATPNSVACFSEVQLGLIPATISPYAVQAIGVRASRRYMLTAERISAQIALELGLFHQVCESTDLDEVLTDIINHVLSNSPIAVAETKALIERCADNIDDGLIHHTATLIANARASEHGQHGLSAFLNKTEPNWRSKVVRS